MLINFKSTLTYQIFVSNMNSRINVIFDVAFKWIKCTSEVLRPVANCNSCYRLLHFTAVLMDSCKTIIKCIIKSMYLCVIYLCISLYILGNFISFPSSMKYAILLQVLDISKAINEILDDLLLLVTFRLPLDLNLL